MKQIEFGSRHCAPFVFAQFDGVPLSFSGLLPLTNNCIWLLVRSEFNSLFRHSLRVIMDVIRYELVCVHSSQPLFIYCLRLLLPPPPEAFLRRSIHSQSAAAAPPVTQASLLPFRPPRLLRLSAFPRPTSHPYIHTLTHTSLTFPPCLFLTHSLPPSLWEVM